MALGSTQPITEMSTRRISWGQMRPVRKADNLTTFLCLVMTSGNLNFLEPSGPLQACNGTALPYLFIYFLPSYLLNLTNYLLEKTDIQNVTILKLVKILAF